MLYFRPDIIFAEGVGRRNCDSKYFGRNVYNPAIGRICNTLLAVLNISISFFNNLFTVFGKSEKYDLEKF